MSKELKEEINELWATCGGESEVKGARGCKRSLPGAFEEQQEGLEWREQGDVLRELESGWWEPGELALKGFRQECHEPTYLNDRVQVIFMMMLQFEEREDWMVGNYLTLLQLVRRAGGKAGS